VKARLEFIRPGFRTWCERLARVLTAPGRALRCATQVDAPTHAHDYGNDHDVRQARAGGRCRAPRSRGRDGATILRFEEHAARRCTHPPDSPLKNALKRNCVKYDEKQRVRAAKRKNDNDFARQNQKRTAEGVSLRRKTRRASAAGSTCTGTRRAIRPTLPIRSDCAQLTKTGFHALPSTHLV